MVKKAPKPVPKTSKKAAKTKAAPPRKAPAAQPAKKTGKPARYRTAMPSRPKAPAAKRSPTPAKATPAGPAPKPGGTDKEALAARMAAFSQKVQTEEETPVAVRSWSEAKADKPASKQLLPKTGAVTPTDEEEEEPVEEEETVEDAASDAEPASEEGEEEPAEEDDEEEPPRPADKPQMNPLTGPMAVPKDRELEFEVAPRHKIKKAGKGGEKPEEFGPVELRQATASGGRHITRSLPENLQRGAERIQPLATGQEKAGGKKKAAPERFEVSMDKRAGPKLPDISDWGDIEIGQQTLSGSRKVGTLTPEQEEERRREEEKRRSKK